MSRLEPGLKFEVDLSKEKAKPTDEIAGPLGVKEQRQKALSQFDAEVDRINEVGSQEQTQSTVDSYVSHAMTLYKHDEFQLAKNLLYKALEQDPYYEPAIHLMGLCNHRLENFSEALRCFEEALDIKESFGNFSGIAHVLYDLSDDELASKYYLKAVEQCEYDSPKLFEVYKNLGNISVRQADYESAEEYYNKAYTLDPDSDVLLVNYGTLEIQKGNLERALERFRDAVEINLDNDKAWVGLALIHRSYGDIDLSRANLERCLDSKFDNQTALNLLIDWSFSDQRFNNVRERLEKYLAHHSDDYEMSFQLARVLTVLGQYSAAHTEIERCLSFQPSHEDAETLLQYIVEKKREQEVRA